MNVDRNEKIWAWSSTGSKVHAFVTEVPGSMGSHLRAMCRSTINRNAHTTFTGQDEVDYSQICLTCLNKAIDMWDRAEASMEPAQERHDIGYVAPAQVEERSTPEKVAKPRTWGQELGTVTERHDVGYVAPQTDEKAVTEDIHAEAVELDELEAIKAELIGKVFKPSVNKIHRKSTDRITVTDVQKDPWFGFGVGVVYDIETDDWRGRRVTLHSACTPERFRKRYVPVEDEKSDLSEALAFLRNGWDGDNSVKAIEAFAVLDAGGVFDSIAQA